MDKTEIPIAYTTRLTLYLAGHPLGSLADLFAEDACVERYVMNEPPRVYSGIEQIEESLLRLPPTGGSFHVRDVQVEGNIVHAHFFTRDFPYPLSGVYRFELDPSGRIQRLYISARYNPSAE